MLQFPHVLRKVTQNSKHHRVNTTGNVRVTYTAALSFKHCSCGKTVSITQSELVYL